MERMLLANPGTLPFFKFFDAFHAATVADAVPVRYGVSVYDLCFGGNGARLETIGKGCSRRMP